MENTTIAAAAWTDDARWNALCQRDAAAEGAFWYGVQTTGVYCRPTCAARRPNRENVQFFAQPEDAERAGFRPCLRCCPNGVTPVQSVVARVQHCIETADTTLSLEELAAEVGWSAAHLQKTFKRMVGVSPKQYAAAHRTAALKRELKQGETVTAAMYEAGYGSSRAVYETAQTQLGMTPGAYKRGGAGQRITYDVQDCPLGSLLVAATEAGVCAVSLGNNAEEVTAQLRAEFPQAELVPDAETVGEAMRAAVEYLQGQAQRFEMLPLDTAGTAFQKRVWDALRAIPYGQTRSYSEIARSIGEPSAVRAVARACATNPAALIVPCHRVVNASGGLSGYRWGVERKRQLLDMERGNAALPLL